VAAVGDDLSIKPRAGVVLLTNGELLKGTIISSGDRYDVQMESGEISLKRSDVALVARDAQECYERQRAGIEPGRAAEHLDLAEWCVRNKLYQSAAKEIAAARAADPAHPRLVLVESRLQLAKDPPPGAAPATPRVAQQPLDNMARNLPPGAMEHFTNTIQPLLLNYCAKSGCHAGRGQGGLQLERIHPRLSGRSATQRNLRRALELVDLEKPHESKLLQAPIRPHGPARAPIFTNRQQPQYKQLVEWVYAMAAPGKPPEEPTLAERTAPLLQAVPGASGPSEPDGDAALDPVDAPKPAPDDANEDAALPDQSRGFPRDASQIPASSADQAFTREQLREMGLSHHATSRVRHGADTPPPFVPKDPFDPEIFNRRFFGR
jgi:hypothetical protein